MDQGKGADQVGVGQVSVEAGHLLGHQKALVDEDPAGETADVEVVGGFFRYSKVVQAVLDDLADDVEAAVELERFRLGSAGWDPDEDLSDNGHDLAGLPSQAGGVDGNIAPSEEDQPFSGDGLFDEGLALQPVVALGRQEHNTAAVRSCVGKVDAGFGTHFLEEVVRHLDQDAGPVAGFRVTATSPPVSQVYQHLQRLVDYRVGLDALDVCHHPHTAGVMLCLRSV